ncbi:MAG TPA: isoaspartyl peptidase/L-asparaginase [Byssovorax sp.]
MSAFVLELPERSFCVLVHGGAGDVAESRRERHVEGCARAAAVGRAVLAGGGAALDAVEAAVRALEDDPVFNAGTGACLTSEGEVEHDASIMSGADLRAGAVCALRGFAAPVSIARAALEDGRHVLYAAEGARAFALSRGFQEAPAGSLVTDAARDALELARRAGAALGWAGGTVGAVARDGAGHVAAATSTGGVTNKRPGRVGDSPIVGAGNYADDASGAVSTTGHGEGMMRLVVAHSITEALAAGASPGAAAGAALDRLAARIGSTGGAIVISARGALGLARTTRTMSWAAAGASIDERGV